jgi:hypothetical protein
MKVALLFLLLGAGAAHTAWIPQDVANHLQRRQMCNHWAGEEPYDKARAAEIAKAVNGLRCTTLDGDEKKLRRRYRHYAPARAALDKARSDYPL